MRHVFSSRKKDRYDTIKIGSKTYKTADAYKQDVSDHVPIMLTLQF